LRYAPSGLRKIDTPNAPSGIPCHASNSGSFTRSGCAIPRSTVRASTTITEYFRALGYDQYADAKQTGEDFHVVKSVIEYKAPVRFDWELDVGARVARIGNSSLTFELAIFLKGGNEALVTGEIVWVNTNQQTHRPVPISKAIRERIAAREKHLT
jgi:acyl-CoA thioester hydrolase